MGCSESGVSANQPAVMGQGQIVESEHVPVSQATPLQNGAKFDTVVIGAGMAGVAAAVELAKAGQKVALF